MKLYTEEQVIELTKASFTAGRNHNSFIFWEELKNITPIELPSDEEILIPFPTEEDENFRDGKEIKNWMNGWGKGYKEALHVMRNKIQGGNNEQQ